MGGFYNSLLSFIDKAVDEGFISPTARRIIVSQTHLLLYIGWVLSPFFSFELIIWTGISHLAREKEKKKKKKKTIATFKNKK